jgi:hypothetical protein
MEDKLLNDGEWGTEINGRRWKIRLSLYFIWSVSDYYE